MEKTETKEKQEKKVAEPESFSAKEIADRLKNARHKADIPLTVLAVLITLGLLAFLSYAAVTARENEEVLKFLTEVTGFGPQVIQFILRVGGDIALVFMAVLLLKIVEQNITFLGKMLSGEMRLSDSRFSEIKEIYNTWTGACGLKIVPEIFISGSDYKSEVLNVPVRSNKVISIDKKMILAAEKSGDWTEVEYTLARRLAKIYLGYYGLPDQLFTFSVKLIPGLKQLLSRCRTYSVDRVVMALLGPEEAIEQTFCQCYDVDLYRDLDREAIVDHKLRSFSRAEKLSKFLENAGSETPISPFRLEAMLNPEKDGRLF